MSSFREGEGGLDVQRGAIPQPAKSFTELEDQMDELHFDPYGSDEKFLELQAQHRFLTRYLDNQMRTCKLMRASLSQQKFT